MHRYLIDALVLLEAVMTGGLAVAPENPENYLAYSSTAGWPAPPDEPTHQDIVLLKDGTQLYGSLQSVPPLYYSFGKLPFDLQEVSKIEIFPAGNTLKASYTTHEGQEFIGTIKDAFVLFSGDPSLSEKSRKINIHDIRRIALYDREPDQPYPQTKFYSLDWKNGDRLVFINCTQAIGLKDRHLPFKNIVNVKIDGGVYGCVKENGVQKDLALSQLKDRYLTIYLEKLHQTVRIPWASLARIQPLDKHPRKSSGDSTSATNDTYRPGQSETAKRSTLPDDIALAPEAFEAFLQPISYPHSPAGSDQSGNPDTESLPEVKGQPSSPQDEPNENGAKGKNKSPEAILDPIEEFDSPIMAAYEFEPNVYIGEVPEIQIPESEQIAIADELEAQEERHPHQSPSEKPGDDPKDPTEDISIDVLQDIDEALIFESLKTDDADPEAFDVDLEEENSKENNKPADDNEPSAVAKLIEDLVKEDAVVDNAGLTPGDGQEFAGKGEHSSE